MKNGTGMMVGFMVTWQLVQSKSCLIYYQAIDFKSLVSRK